MTEAEWLTAVDPATMLMFLRGQTSDRKLRLLACASCRLAWSLLVDPGRYAVEVAERYADGNATDAERSEARQAAHIAQGSSPNRRSHQMAIRAAYESVQLDARSAATRTRVVGDCFDDPHAFQKEQPTLLRDIFGNPFRPVALLPEWRTSTVLALAQQMYEARDFSAMPILADALQDAGCADESVLTHCRGPGPHVRGCHVVDACLGKS